MDDYNEIIPRVFVGSLDSFLDKNFMRDRVGAVVSVIHEMDFCVDVSHLYVKVHDVEDENIALFFPVTYHFIQSQLVALPKEKGVLIHCAAGISRSVTIMAHYLMKANKWDVERSISWIRKKRPQANPNRGFIKQLKDV